MARASKLIAPDWLASASANALYLLAFLLAGVSGCSQSLWRATRTMHRTLVVAAANWRDIHSSVLWSSCAVARVLGSIYLQMRCMLTVTRAAAALATRPRLPRTATAKQETVKQVTGFAL